MDERDAAERNFLKQFNDYDQTVDVVSCWHCASTYLLNKAFFFRFGKFGAGPECEFTPDFAIAESKDGKTADPGSIVCDVKKFPHPYPESGSKEEQEAANKIFGASVEEIFKYAVPLTYLSGHGNLPRLAFTEHDVVLLTPSEIIDPVYAYLVSRLGSKPFNVGRPLVLVEYFYSQGERLERYVFKWKHGEANSPFSNPVLQSKMVLKSQPLTVYPKRFLEYKIRYVLCNDPPPTIYLLVFIWVEVLLKFLSPEEIELWQNVGTSRIKEIELTAQQLHDKLRNEYSAPFSMHDVRHALKALCGMKRAVLKDSGKELYVIQFYNLASRPFREAPGDQERLADRAKFKEYSRIFAQLLAKKELAQPPPARSRARFRSSRRPVDHPRLPFPE